MLSSRKPFVGARAMALVVAALVGAVCLVVAVMASVGSSGTAEAKTRSAAADNNPLKYVTENSRANNISPNTKVTATATCPANSSVLSGGFDLHYSRTNPWHIIESRPLNSGAWRVTASLARSWPNIKPFTAYAVCAPQRLVPPEDIHYPDKTAQNPRFTYTQLTPDCRASYQAIGGGFDMSKGGPTDRLLVRSQPNPGGGFGSWIVKVNTLKAPGGDVTAYSVCIQKGLVKNLGSSQRAQNGISGIVQVGTERCQQGTYLLAGGGGTAEGDARYIEWSHIRPGGGSQADPPKDWAVGAKGGFTKSTIHSHAMCGELVGPKDGGQK